MWKKCRKILHISWNLHHIIEDFVFLREKKDSINDKVIIWNIWIEELDIIIKNYDIILFHFIDNLDRELITNILTNYSSKKIGFFMHTYYPFYEDWTWINNSFTEDLFLLEFIKKLDFFIVQDNNSKSFIKNYFKNKRLNEKAIFLLWQYINAEKVFTKKIESNKFRIGFIWSFSYIKWFDLIKYLLWINTILDSLNIELYLFTLKDTSKDIIIDDNINYAKKNKNINIIFNEYNRKNIYSKLDCLIIPSIWNETWPMVLYEAFINKIPVIVSDKESLKEKIIDRVDSYIFKTWDERELLKWILWMQKNYNKIILNNNGFCYNKLMDYKSELKYFLEKL